MASFVPRPARMFIGVVTVEGAKGATVNTQLQRASRLNSGTRFTESQRWLRRWIR